MSEMKSNVKVVGQYLKDLSFEVPMSPEIFLAPQEKPEIGLVIDIDAKKISEQLYEVSLKIVADAKAKEKVIFICEAVYAGIFSIQNIEEEMLEQILLIYCPNLLFPFIRRIIANNTIDGAFPPLMLDPIDFTDLYNRRQKLSESDLASNTKN
ncbi:MAG: protein-export chaperone SecB [Rickettsiales bacterium]|nr:protein-export chaperone SecB [Rickettsiales bacterium]